ncbi:MAG TPA: hypothetical protein VF832_03645 [Longimicrobiales bacterium]
MKLEIGGGTAQGFAWRLAAALVAWLAVMAVAVAPAAAQDYSGDGPGSTPLLQLPGGSLRFRLQHQGSGSYHFQLLDAGGKLVQDVVSGSGALDGSGEAQVPRAGQYRVAVTGSGPWAIHLLARSAAPGAGEQPAAGVATVGADLSDTAAVPAVEQGRRDGLAAGRASTPWSWRRFATGLGAGIVAGPIGAAVATVAAGHGTVRVPTDSLVPGGRPGDYLQGWRSGFASGAIGSRRESALVGGLAGTLVFGWAVLRLAHLGSQGSSSINGNGGGTNGNAILMHVAF